MSKKPVGYNADDFPSNPVPVDHGQCENSQTFAATSAQPSTGNSTCVGLTMAFGPMGDLKPYLDRVTQDRGRRQVGAQARQGSIYAKRPNGKCPSATDKPQEKTKP